MKSFFIPVILILVGYGPVYGQKGAGSQPGSFMLGASFSNDYCSHTRKDPAESFWYEQGGPKYGYTAGLSGVYNLTSRIGVNMGLQFSRKGFRAVMAVPDYQIDPRTGFVFDDNAPRHIDVGYNYYYLDIPLEVSYKMGENKVRMITSVGVAANIFLNDKTVVRYQYPDRTDKKDEGSSGGDFRSVNLSFHLGAGLEYQLNPNHYLRLVPTFRHTLFLTTRTPIGEYLWSAGLNVGYYFTLNNR